MGEDGKVRRSPQDVACRKRYVKELGKPQRLLLDREVEEYGQRESPPHGEGLDGST
jgi:hypothetical protein